MWEIERDNLNINKFTINCIKIKLSNKISEDFYKLIKNEKYEEARDVLYKEYKKYNQKAIIVGVISLLMLLGNFGLLYYLMESIMNLQVLNIIIMSSLPITFGSCWGNVIYSYIKNSKYKFID